MRRVLPALLLLLVPAGCGTGETTELDGRVVELTVEDYRYDRQRVSVPGGRITFALTNAGSEPTNFRVRRRQRDLLSIATLAPGERGTATARLRPGEYVMYSSVGRHETLGEHGTLIVRPGPTSPQPAPSTGTRPRPKRPSPPPLGRRSP